MLIHVLGAQITVRLNNMAATEERERDREIKPLLTKLPPGPPLVAAGADAGIEYMTDGDGDGAGALVVALCSWKVSAKQDYNLNGPAWISAGAWVWVVAYAKQREYHPSSQAMIVENEQGSSSPPLARLPNAHSSTDTWFGMTTW